MAFDGRDYHQAFEEACVSLPLESDTEAVRSELQGIEWILWEAIRAVFFYISVAVGCLVVLPIGYMHGARETLVGSAFLVGSFGLTVILVYWLCRVVFHFQIAAHVKGRRFGSGGLDR